MSQATLGRAIRHALVASVIAGAAPVALAQETQAPPDAGSQSDTTTLDRIEVTGSRIMRTDTETASPIQVIQRQEIDRTGKTNLGEYLQSLTVDGSGSVPKSFGAGFASGASGVSLRGLGAGSTLVLVNGRRIASYGLADDGQKVFTDLSIIPLEAVERVEVLKDGASSIYGSDAIAGVVNVILRRDFTGAILKGSYGTSGNSDGNERKFSVTWGTGDLAEDGFNFFFSAEAAKSDEIFVRDRKDRKWIGNGDISRYGYDPTQFGGLFGFISDPTSLGGTSYNSPVGNVQGIGPDGLPVGNVVSLQDAAACSQLSTATIQDPNGGCVWDSAQFTSLQPEQEYVNFFSRGTFALSDTAEFYAELGYGKKKSSFHNTPNAVSGTWASPDGGAVNANDGPDATIIGANHPDNPLGVDARLRYSAFDVGPRTVDVENQFARLLVGVKGVLGEWDYDVGYLHSETNLTSQRNNYLRYSRVREVLTDGDNSPVGWWRLGANAGLNSQALYDYISPTIGTTAETKLEVVDAKASRSLMDLPGGPLGLAVGAEWRRDVATLPPVTYTDQSDIIGLGYSAYDGAQEVTAAYVELNAPVLESLELNAALRMDDYKDGENSVTPKFGIKWKPADWIALRGTYAEGFRAPNPAETAGSSVGFATASNPVRCAIDVDPGTPGVQTPVNCPGPVAFINRPNSDLEPEESKSYSVGLVLQPTSSTTLTLDAWQIKRENEIATASLAEALAAGDFIVGDDLVNGVPGSGSLLAVFTSYINATSTKVSGIDLDARQTFDLGTAGRLALDLQWSHIDKYEFTDTDGTKYDFAGTHDNCNVTNCIGTPKDRINFGATWDIGDWSVSGVANYRGKFDNVAPYSVGSGCAAVFADGDDAPGGCEIPSFYTIDLSANWKATDAFEVFGSVQNATDRIAPLDPTTYGGLNYNPLDFSGAIGRFYTLGVKYSFK
ncbi:MAG TPA: TonB-dependent receptor [Luteimonas sp.]|nr:TonB-dependent receptor [Luteimonas sp.]